MDVKLKVLDGKNAGKEVAVSAKKFIVGRAEDCHLRPGSDLVSRHHCAITSEEGYVAIRDFGSKNGTLVNDERVVGERELKSGDRLQIGPLQFEVVLTSGIGGKKRPPVTDMKEAAARSAGSGSSAQLDVTQWLEGDPAEESRVAAKSAGETQRFKVGDTSEIDTGVTRQDVPHDSIPQPAIAPEPVKAEKKPIGKLPPRPASTGKDSRDAATKMLEQFRKKR